MVSIDFIVLFTTSSIHLYIIKLNCMNISTNKWTPCFYEQHNEHTPWQESSWCVQIQCILRIHGHVISTWHGIWTQAFPVLMLAIPQHMNSRIEQTRNLFLQFGHRRLRLEIHYCPLLLALLQHSVALQLVQAHCTCVPVNKDNVKQLLLVLSHHKLDGLHWSWVDKATKWKGAAPVDHLACHLPQCLNHFCCQLVKECLKDDE